MGDNKDYKDLVILAIVTIGISIAWFAYLTYIRDKETREKIQPLNMLSGQQNIPEISYDRPVYDERLYKLLENQQSQLEHINSNINSLKPLNYTQYKSPSLGSLGVNKLSQSRAGSVTSIKTTEEDKTRQKDFGMI